MPEKNSFTFRATGIPRPQGSKDQFGRESCPYVKPWRYDVKCACEAARPEDWDKTTRIGISAVFTFVRPKKHFTLKGGLREDAPYYVVARKGDIDKLSRALLDSLSGVAYDDDDQVVNLSAAKRYVQPGEDPGVICTILKLPA